MTRVGRGEKVWQQGCVRVSVCAVERHPCTKVVLRRVRAQSVCDVVLDCPLSCSRRTSTPEYIRAKLKTWLVLSTRHSSGIVSYVLCLSMCACTYNARRARFRFALGRDAWACHSRATAHMADMIPRMEHRNIHHSLIHAVYSDRERRPGTLRFPLGSHSLHLSRCRRSGPPPSLERHPLPCSPYRRASRARAVTVGGECLGASKNRRRSCWRSRPPAR